MEGYGEPIERTISIPLKDEDPTKVVQIKSLLDEETRARLINFLRSNADIFAWSATDMLEISSKIITHQLKVDPKFMLVQQKKRNFSPER